MRGYQIIWMWTDFWDRFGSFLSILGCLGAPPGGLGHHLEPKGRFCVIWVPFPGQSLVPFGSFFDAFYDHSWRHFLEPFCKALFVKYGTKSIQNGKHLDVILRSYFITGDVLICETPLMRTFIFLSREYTQNTSFLVTILRMLSGEALEQDFCQFWAISGSPWEPIGFHNGIKKWDPKNDGKRERS